MTTSEAINELATALAKAQGAMEGASKSAANPFFRSKYADLASVWDACREPLSKNGLSIVQFPTTSYQGEPQPYEWTAKNSGEVRYGVRVACVVSVTTRMLHSSGQWIEDTVSTMLPTADPQAVGSAISYLRRYSLQSVAGVAPEDDDAETAQGRGSQASRPQAVQTRAPEPAGPPKGFDDWLLDMKATADLGLARLNDAWKSSRADYANYLRKTNLAHWEALKAHAKSVDDKAAKEQVQS